MLEKGYLHLQNSYAKINCLNSSSNKKDNVLLIWNQMEVKL